MRQDPNELHGPRRDVSVYRQDTTEGEDFDLEPLLGGPRDDEPCERQDTTEGEDFDEGVQTADDSEEGD